MFSLNLYWCADALRELGMWVCHHSSEVLLLEYASPGPIVMVTVQFSSVRHGFRLYLSWSAVYSRCGALP
jgi:hypothetical protein